MLEKIIQKEDWIAINFLFGCWDFFWGPRFFIFRFLKIEVDLLVQYVVPSLALSFVFQYIYSESRFAESFSEKFYQILKIQIFKPYLDEIQM